MFTTSLRLTETPSVVGNELTVRPSLMRRNELTATAATTAETPLVRRNVKVTQLKFPNEWPDELQAYLLGFVELGEVIRWQKAGYFRAVALALDNLSSQRQSGPRHRLARAIRSELADVEFRRLATRLLASFPPTGGNSFKRFGTPQDAYDAMAAFFDRWQKAGAFTAADFRGRAILLLRVMAEAQQTDLGATQKGGMTALATLFAAWIENGLPTSEDDRSELQTYLKTLVEEGMFPLSALREMSYSDHYLGIPVNKDIKRAVAEKINNVLKNWTTELSGEDYEAVIKRAEGRSGFHGNAAWQELLATHVTELERGGRITDVVAKATSLEKVITQRLARTPENKLLLFRGLTFVAVFLILCCLHPFSSDRAPVGWVALKGLLIVSGLLCAVMFTIQKYFDRPTLSPAEESLLQRTRCIIRSKQEDYTGAVRRTGEREVGLPD
jgi:hypothetical protein